MTNDSGKNANVTKYNFLNQPQVLKIGTDPSVTNFWDANGNLHKQIQHLPGNEERVRYYQDGIEYVTGPNDEILIESIHHGEGRYVYEYDETGKFKRNYHEFVISDHLGNVRVRFADLNGDGKINVVAEGPGQEKEVLGSYHYYPYGMEMEGIFHPEDLVDNMYRYNGIEYLSHQGLNVSLATWRTHDAAIGRWWQVDPAAESMYGYNPFNAMGDNPMSYSDPDGDFLHLALIGAAIGVAANGIGNIANGENFFKGGFQAGFFGAMGGMFSAGVGGAFTALGKAGTTLAAEIAQAGFHGLHAGMMSTGQGGGFGSGFLSGAVSSGISSATSGASTGIMIAAGGISGGIGSAIGGGSFWDGLGQGLITSGLNHAAHVGYSYLEATIHVRAVRAFLEDEGFNPNQVRNDVVAQTDGFFGKYYAMLLNEDRYINGWAEQIDSRGGIGYVSNTRSLVVSKRAAKWGIQEIREGFALKFYPGRSSSIGIIRSGAAHYIESGFELIDGGIRGVTGRDNVVYNMHYLNSRDYLRYR